MSVKSKKKQANAGESSAAQQHIDEIMQLEIELADELAAAESMADAGLSRTLADIEQMKQNIFKGARQEREQLMEDTLAAARQTAQQSEETAIAAGQELVAAGSSLIDEAAARVVGMILPKNNQEAV